MLQGLTPQERADIRARLGQVMGDPVANVLVEVLDQVAVRRDEMVTRQDFQELRESVSQLVEGQQAMQAAINRLTEAQIRSEERLGRLEEAQARLAEAQVGVEERLGRLEEAQIRSEERLGRLEDALTRLAEAQQETQKELRELAEAQKQTQLELQRLNKQVGGLSDWMGGDLEDAACSVLYAVLTCDLGWKVSSLKRTYVKWNGQIEEIDLFGQASDPARLNRSIWIVGEAKHNLTVRDVNRFAKQLERARQNLKGEIFPVCFCYRARPEVQARAQELGIRLVFSYGKLI
jgi:uncharacterized phage infection (PIP) family protein YhgE